MGRCPCGAGDPHGYLRPRREGCQDEARPMTAPSHPASTLPAPAADRGHLAFSPYRVFSREEWAKPRADPPTTLGPRDLGQLSGVIEDLSMREVEQIPLPLSRLLNL